MGQTDISELNKQQQLRGEGFELFQALLHLFWEKLDLCTYCIMEPLEKWEMKSAAQERCYNGSLSPGQSYDSPDEWEAFFKGLKHLVSAAWLQIVSASRGHEKSRLSKFNTSLTSLNHFHTHISTTWINHKQTQLAYERGPYTHVGL